MSDPPKHEASPGQPAADVASFGLIRPPLVYAGSIGLGLLVHWLWPVRLLPASVGVPVGVLVVLAAVALFVSAVRTFRKASIPVPGNRPFTLFQLGLAAWVNSLGLLLTLFPALALMALVVIPREERYLEARFPSEYPPYKRAVRRWL
jgi:protein-S-isoprenylcysteine O-methyltransferase Ste14